jgi:hypothetical protein
MLTVREEQIDVFERRLFEAVQRRVEYAIAATFPEIAGDRPAAGPDARGEDRTSRVRSVVERGIENAVGVDIGDAPDFAAFIALGVAMRLTPPGPSGNWIHAWLMRPDAPGQTKLRMIESRLKKLAKQDPAIAAVAKRVEMARERMTP